MKNSLVRASLMLLTATWIGAACSGNDNAQTTSQDPQCEEVMVDGETYCVWKQSIIIETGYIPRCPARLSYRYESDGLIMCSTRTTPPTKPIVFDIWRLAYNEAPPEEGDMGQMMPDADMGGMPDSGGPLSCTMLAQSYRDTVANALDRSCSQDVDCKVIEPDCHMGGGEVGCTLAANVGADTSALMTLQQRYDAQACRANQANCVSCAPAEAVCNQGTCEAKATVARTCEQVKEDYATSYDSLPTACQKDEDCEYARVTGCGVTEGVSETCKAVATVTDGATRMTLAKEYDTLGCPPGPECNICASEPVSCEQGQCVVSAPRTCEDIKEDYAAVYAAFPTSCQAAADCRDAGLNACGIASEVAGGCQIAVSTSADFSPLMPLSQEYQALGCNTNDPICAACAGNAVDCVQGVCTPM